MVLISANLMGRVLTFSNLIHFDEVSEKNEIVLHIMEHKIN